MMTREEFFEWLDTCPTHKWEITHEEYGYAVVSFPIDEFAQIVVRLNGQTVLPASLTPSHSEMIPKGI